MIMEQQLLTRGIQGLKGIADVAEAFNLFKIVTTVTQPHEYTQEFEIT